MTRLWTRGAMLVALCLVLWGTLFDLALLHALLTRGTPGLQDLLAPPLHNVAAAWANRLCGVLALVAGAFAIGAFWSSPRKGA